MALQTTHELHKRRFGRNLGVALCLVAFVALVFALTIVKIRRGESMEGYDHTMRPDLAAPEMGTAADAQHSAPAVPQTGTTTEAAE